MQHTFFCSLGGLFVSLSFIASCSLYLSHVLLSSCAVIYFERLPTCDTWPVEHLLLLQIILQGTTVYVYHFLYRRGEFQHKFPQVG